MLNLKKELLKVTTEEETNEILSIFKKHAENFGINLEQYNKLYSVTTRVYESLTYEERFIDIVLIDSYANTKTLSFGEY